MSIEPGTRVIVDQGRPMMRPLTCFQSGCRADYDASGELIPEMKRGTGLVLQWFNGAGQAVNLVLPLRGFQEAYEGTPTDPKAFEAQCADSRLQSTDAPGVLGQQNSWRCNNGQKIEFD